MLQEFIEQNAEFGEDLAFLEELEAPGADEPPSLELPPHLKAKKPNTSPVKAEKKDLPDEEEEKIGAGDAVEFEENALPPAPQILVNCQKEDEFDRNVAIASDFMQNFAYENKLVSVLQEHLEHVMNNAAEMALNSFTEIPDVLKTFVFYRTWLMKGSLNG